MVKNQIDTQSSTHLDLWNRLVEPGGLWPAWQRVRLNEGAAGGDGVTVKAFERKAPERIEALRCALAAGRYRPGPIRRAMLRKDDGGLRPLDIPCVGDRVVQTTVAHLLVPLAEPEMSPHSFAYRPGRSVAQAVAAVARARRDGYRWTAEGDVRRCFEEIPHAPLLRALEQVCDDPRITDLVALWLETHAPEGIGIPQGSPVSPLLCNLHLDAVDDAIAGHGVRLVRYADDFVLLTRTAAAAEAALARMEALLRQRGLALNADKTRVRAYDQSLRFLGHVFTRGMAWKEVWDDEKETTDAPPEAALAHDKRAGETPATPEEVRPRRRNVVYLVEAGARLTVRGESFLLTARGEEEGETRNFALRHPAAVDRIEIGPGARADWAALELAALHGVAVAAADGFGETSGWWSGPGSLRGRRIMAQARFLADPARERALAHALATGRMRNQRALLRRANRERKDSDIAAACVAIGRLIDRADPAEAVNSQRGHEGASGALYWPAYARLFEASLGFGGKRVRRPPGDAVNACLSYSAALLEREIRVAIGRAGLHPGMGALHAARDGGDALVYDLMEAFRAPVCEAMVAALAGRRALRPEMFVVADYIREDGTSEKVCRMERPARKALIRGHEAWLARPIQSQRSRKRIGWRALFEEEARALAAHFAGEEDFRPYQMDH